MGVDKEYYKKLTLAVYKVTESFPNKEPLKWQIRELANKILADLILANPSPVTLEHKKGLIKQMQILRSFFDVAEGQDWVNGRNFFVLKTEYDKITQTISAILPAADVHCRVVHIKDASLERQEKISSLLKEKQNYQIGELAKAFPEVSRRTIIRDMEELCRLGKVARSGNGRGICYNLIM